MGSNDSKAPTDISRAFSQQRVRLNAIARRAGAQESEDVVQEAFLQVVETSQRETVRKVDHLLARVARCVAIDRVRRRATRPATCQPEIAEAVEGGIDPERVLIGSQRLQRVLAIIDEMPPRRREVFLLHRIDELTYPQIAKRLGVSIKAVEKHVCLALKQLVEGER